MVQSYVHGLDLVSKINNKNKPDYYLYDGLGSVVGLTNQQGALTTKYSYDEYGIPSPSSKFGKGGERANTYGFTGEAYDQDTELLYLRVRCYMPEVGRFVTKDPFSGFLATPLGQNLYTYCQNSPINYTDLTGYGPRRGPYPSRADRRDYRPYVDPFTQVLPSVKEYWEWILEGEWPAIPIIGPLRNYYYYLNHADEWLWVVSWTYIIRHWSLYDQSFYDYAREAGLLEYYATRTQTYQWFLRQLVARAAQWGLKFEWGSRPPVRPSG